MNDEVAPLKASDRFRKMAERIDLNSDSTFGGAVVVYPPAGGAPIEMLILDAQGDPAQFWSTVMTRIQITLEALKNPGMTMRR